MSNCNEIGSIPLKIELSQEEKTAILLRERAEKIRVQGKIDNKLLRVTMPDGSKWDVPVRKIAEHRARYYMKDPELGTFEKSYNEDTIPLFESDDYAIEDWAANNMNWKDIVAFARKVESHKMADSDFQEGWINGDKEIVEGSK